MTLLARARAALEGFRGRFFYDAERGDIGWIAKACDDKHCDCEVHLNADGDQDCSQLLSDWKGEDHINEPLVVMLNAVPELVAEVERWENCAICIECGRCSFDEDGCCATCGRDVIGFENGKLVDTGVADHIDAIEADRYRLLDEVKRLQALVNEACDISGDAIDKLGGYLPDDHMKVAIVGQHRLLELRLSAGEKGTL